MDRTSVKLTFILLVKEFLVLRGFIFRDTEIFFNIQRTWVLRLPSFMSSSKLLLLIFRKLYWTIIDIQH